jgi:WD40 repeat protein
MTMRRVRIFISSPGDVAEERDRARQVIEQLQRWYGSDRVQLEPVLWEDLPLQFDSSFQRGIDAVLSASAGIDIAVFILWSRLGSPLGGSLRRPDGSEYKSGTEREFELMLAARAATGGKRPALLAYVRTDDEAFHQTLKGKSAEELKALVEQLQSAKSFVEENFRDAEGRNLRAYHSFDAPLGFARRLKVHLRSLVDELISAEAPPSPRWTRAPYRGLETFDLDDAPIFFGRERETCDVEEALRRRERNEGIAFLCIVGASGAGKSSLARAGVAASLARYNLDEFVAQWRIATVVPRQIDGTLVEGVGKALAAAVPELRARDGSIEPFVEAIASDPQLAVVLSLRPVLQSMGAARVLLIVDQLEEVYATPNVSGESRERFWRALERLARSGLVWVLATLRSDFYALAQADPGFLRLKGVAGHHDLAPPSAEGLAALISQPAALAGLQFEKGAEVSLEARILEEALAQRDALPLVEYLLTELYSHRTVEGVLTVEAHAQLGGVAGAIGRRAEAVFGALDAVTQAALPRVVRLLVTVRADGIVSARAAPRAAFPAQSREEALVLALTQERLLIAEGDGTEAKVRVAHEALLSRWPLARQLIEADRERLVARARLEEAYGRWVAQGRRNDLLLPLGLPLAEAESLVRAWPDELDDQLRGYVAASQAHARRKRHILRGLAGAASLILLALASWALVNTHRARERLREAQVAESRFLNERATSEKDLREAILLLLEALPVDGDRPLVPEVLRNLSKQVNDGVPAMQFKPTGGVTDADISPDGKRVVTMSSDGSAILWAVASGKQLLTVSHSDGDSSGGNQAHTRRDPRGSASFSTDGGRLLTVSSGAAVLWDATTGKQVHVLQQAGGVARASFEQGSRKVLTVSSDHKTLAIWDVGSARQLSVFSPGHSGATLDPSGRFLLIPGRNEVSFWDTTSGKLFTRLARQTTAHAFSPDGTRVAMAIDRTVGIWDLRSKKRLLALEHRGAVNSIAYSPDGHVIATGGDELTIWDATLGIAIQSTPGKIDAVTFSATGQHLITDDGEVTTLWAAPSSIASLGEANRLQSFRRTGVFRSGKSRFSPDGRSVIVTSGDAGALLWRLAGPRMALRHDAGVNVAAFSPDGKLIATGCVDSTVALRDVASGERIRILHHAGQAVSAITFSGDGSLVAVASDDGTATLWDVASGQQKHAFRYPLPHQRTDASDRWRPRAGTAAVLNRDGTRILTAPYDGQAVLWDATSDDRVIQALPHRGRTWFPTFSSDGNRFVTALDSRTVALWEAASGKEVLRFQSGGDVASVAFNPSSTQILTVGKNRTIWDLQTGMQVRSEEDAHETKGVFSPDGAVLLLGTSSSLFVEIVDAVSGKRVELLDHDQQISLAMFARTGTVVTTSGVVATIWDLYPARVIGSLPDSQIIVSASVSPDGKHVVTVTGDKVAALWDLPPAQTPQQYIGSVRARVRALGWCFTPWERTRYFLPPVPEGRREECAP